MKNLCIVVVALLFSTSCSKKIVELPVFDNEQCTIYLVRHAEKVLDGSNDPELTTEGKARAEKLAVLLQDRNVKKIYSTNYSRTRYTAYPLARNTAVQMDLYDPRKKNILNSLNSGKDCHVLVVGHSNTIPALVNGLIGEEKYEDLDESIYTNLYVLQKEKGKWKCTIVQF